ncbi:MAG: hypothetical protein AAF648_16105 [Pseudomonadota bacterium]
MIARINAISASRPVGRIARWLSATLLLGALSLSLPAHALAPIIDLEDQPIPDNLSLEQIKRGIRMGALNKGWVVKDAGSNAFEATLFVRKHVVKVKIAWTRSDYAITYISSQNMKAREGQIHRKYNGWVTNLNNNIQRELYSIL